MAVWQLQPKAFSLKSDEQPFASRAVLSSRRARETDTESDRDRERERVPVDKRKPYKGYTRISGNLFTVAKTKRRHCVVYVPHIESPFVSIPEIEREKESPVLTMSAPMKFIIAIFCLLATAYNIRGE